MAEDTSLDGETEDAVKEAVSPQLISIGATYGAALVGGAIAALIAINYKTSTMAGDTTIHPTNNQTDISKVETAATEVEGKLTKDGVKAKDGDLSAAQTDAKALTTDAKALDSGASAAQPKAGALDVKAKALVMS
jgi:hypothetical protein